MSTPAASRGEVTEANAATTESRARQQIMSELKEAQELMSNSITPEAASFWKAHVAELQGQLRKLDGEEDLSTSASGGSSPEKLQSHSGSFQEQQGLDSYLEANRQTTSDQQDSKHLSSNQRSSMQQSSAQQSLRQKSSVVMAQAEPVASVVETRRKTSNDQNMVAVVAPADLPEGYTFEAQIGKKSFLATVPPGGVKQGMQFLSNMRELENVQIEVPVGGWRDGLFACTKHGIFHPLFLNSLFVPLVSLGQIMGRTRLDWVGNRTDVVTAKTSFTTMATITLFWLAMNCGAIVTICLKEAPSISDYIALGLINATIIGFFIFAVTKTRSRIRGKYEIVEEKCYGYEDCTCAIFCGPCTICQMGRHTADFDSYLGTFCSKTGLPDNVELVSVPSESSNRHAFSSGYAPPFV